MSEENKNLEENIKRHIGVLVEKMDDRFKLLAEGQQDISRKVDLLAEDMDIVKSDIVDIKIELKAIHKELEGKADKEVLNDHETRIASLENAALAST
jgi:hypothetical protein